MNLRRCPTKKILYALVALHVLTGWTLAVALQWIDIFDGLATLLSFGLFLTLLFADVTLAAFWLTLGLSSLKSRFIWSTLAIVYSIVLFFVTFSGVDWGFVSFMLCHAALTVVLLLVLRQWFVRVDRPSPSVRTGTQFRIWHLFLLTFVISLLLAVCKWLPQGSLQDSDSMVSFVTIVIAFAAVGLCSLWATLSRVSLWFGTSLVLAFAFAAGWFVDTETSEGSNAYFAGIVFTGFVLLLLFSLGVVRYCGYRLVPLGEPAETLAKENTATIEPHTPSDFSHAAESDASRSIDVSQPKPIA